MTLRMAGREPIVVLCHEVPRVGDHVEYGTENINHLENCIVGKVVKVTWTNKFREVQVYVKDEDW